MRCILCSNLSLSIICSNCQKTLLVGNIRKRKVFNITIYSFFVYENISDLILTKYTIIGSSVFKILAKITFKEFAKRVNFSNRVYAIPIDDRVTDDRGYSHTAILSSFLKSGSIEPLFGKLRAKNSIKYANKSYKERLRYKRNFIYTGPKNIDVILVDDIVTTGLTMREAYLKLSEYNVNVLFGITLADAKGI